MLPAVGPSATSHRHSSVSLGTRTGLDSLTQTWLRSPAEFAPSALCAWQATQYHPEGKQYAEELMEHYSWYAEDKAKSTSAKDFR